ncbi:nuclease-related domain-containing protein [Cryobacterium sp. BB736]|uniref:nuclease-related domain-containing protein n=1 Tax=Cryobacterium sp. BB736 TaxID=2746963 RepID=UPI0018772B63|nr:nuclease-related domain-containing protein [Cryobacterium sp. BB736]
MSGDASELSLVGRAPGYAVMGEVLRRQETVPPRSGLARFFGLSPLHSDSVSWYWGALGEMAVGRELGKLGPEWMVLHAVPVGTGDSDIDHVLIGPPGVFTINTKHHQRGRIWLGSRMLMVNGQKTDHLRNSRYEAKRASKLLSQGLGFPVDARAILALVGTSQITVKQRPADVVVLTDRELVRWLKRQKPRLSAVELDSLLDVADLRGTWHRSADTDTHTVEEFDLLNAEVTQAYRRRRMWIGLALIAGIALAMSMVGPLLDAIT